MAVSSMPNLFSFFTPSKPLTLKAPPTFKFSVSATNSSASNNDALLPSDGLSGRTGFNVQVFVDDDEHEEQIVGRFRREVMRAGVIQEIKRRRFFENKQEKKKRKARDAARRNRRFSGPRDFSQDNEESKNERDDDEEEDNWELPRGNLPF